MLKNFKKQLSFYFFALITGFSAFAQDPQFSMFYSVPLYLNPAFTGGRHANRALVHQRWQWPSQEAKFYTTQLSFDTYVNKYNSGFGVLALQDYQGGDNLTSTYLSFNYAYELPLTRNKTLRFGLQGGLIQRSAGALSLRSDLSNDGATGGKSFGGRNILLPDIGAGVIFYDRNLFAGITLNHINRPRDAYFGSALMPVKLTIVGGYKIPIPLTGGSIKSKGLHGAPDYLYLTPTFTYKHQGGTDSEYIGPGADQLDIGLYLTRKFFIAGIWYRGLPLKQYKSTDVTQASNYDAMVFLVGVNYNGIGFGYSYDYTISKQQNVRTGGAHEVNLTYVFRTSKKKTIQRTLPCPDFETDILQKAGSGVGK
ncbi:MAG: PorP/SprF family type IX secretion system membrane protein [Cytophagales bacterium]